MRQVTDARGALVGLPDRVERVVSLAPSLTEWLVVAGVGELAAAVGGLPGAAALDAEVAATFGGPRVELVDGRALTPGTARASRPPGQLPPAAGRGRMTTEHLTDG